MVKSEVKVLGAWPSPYSMRPRVALNVKNIDYEFVEEAFGSKSELLLESNPVHKKIPVLIHNGKPICESLVIVEYIDEVWKSGPTILPTDPYERAITRFWAAYIDERWMPSLRSIAAAKNEGEKEVVEQVKEMLLIIEEALLKCGKGNPFFGGEKIGYLDIAFGCSLAWLRVTERLNNLILLDETKTPGLVKWAETFSSDPAVKDVIPGTDKLCEFAKFLKSK